MPQDSRLQAFFKSFWRKKVAVAAGFYIFFLIAVAVLAPYVAPSGPTEVHRGRHFETPSLEFPFGTDNMGRCLLSRMIFGARLSLTIGLVSIGIALGIGGTLGLIAGYFGRTLESIIMRLADIMLAFPAILLALLIIAILGPGLYNLMIAVGFANIPRYIRIVRGSTLSVKEDVFVEAARGVGARDTRIIVRHILPSIMAPIIVISTLGVATAILAAAALSFIGLGPPPPTPEWGAILSTARNYIRRSWWMITFPGIAITSTVLAINMVGDALRDILDPKLKT